MATIFALIGLLAPLTPQAVPADDATTIPRISIDQSMRYRGIDRLFEKFRADG